MRFIIGVDEAGRGPLAGPVSVGVVMVAEGFDVSQEFPGVKDSKKLTEKKREEIFEMLEARVAKGDARFVVELESADAIDREGIAVVIRRAVARGVDRLAEPVGHPVSNFGWTPDVHILLDGSLGAPAEYSQETIIHGDALMPIISLASIAAKVTRDRLMMVLAQKYPQYGFGVHKGYGTRAHYEALREHGLCAIHRRSFVHL
ncbi:MAG: ribonuclease HII [Candidatus Paceibacterota bacterium]|jgi:ribonuclease HII